MTPFNSIDPCGFYCGYLGKEARPVFAWAGGPAEHPGADEDSEEVFKSKRRVRRRILAGAVIATGLGAYGLWELTRRHAKKYGGHYGSGNVPSMKPPFEVTDAYRKAISSGNMDALPPEQRTFLNIDRGKGITNWDVLKTWGALDKARGSISQGKIDVHMDTGVHRVGIPGPDINPGALKHLSYNPSYVAVPEAGQAQLKTYRQPEGFHLHRHTDNWFLHHDRNPPLRWGGKWQNAQSRTEQLHALAGGVTHGVQEGIPGYALWLKNQIHRDPTFEQRHAAGKSAVDRFKSLSTTLRGVI